MALQNFKIQAISVTLALVLSLVYFGNQQNLSHKTDIRNGRFPASVGSITMNSSSLEKLELIEETDLAEEVAIQVHAEV